MEIVGTVISTENNEATVAVRRVSACGENCANCKAGCETSTAVSTVENTVGAVAGDLVKIESDSAGVLRAAVILYIVPVLVAIISAVIAFSSNMRDIFAVALCVASFFASFFVIKAFEKKITPKSYITRVFGKEVK